MNYPELALDVPKEISFFSKSVGNSPDAVNIWMGSEKSISSLHRDPYENVYTVIKGKKIFKLYAPTDRGFIKYSNCPVRRHKMGENGEWKLILIITADEFHMKGALENTKTGEIALMTTAHYSLDRPLEKRSPTKSFDSDWKISRCKMIAPLFFWDELQRRLKH